MANKKNLEFLDLSTEDLAFELESAQAKLLNLKFDNSVAGLEDPTILREVRRDIARMKTEIRKRALGEMTDEQLEGRSKIRARRRRERQQTSLRKKRNR